MIKQTAQMHKIEFGSPSKENQGNLPAGSPSKRKRGEGLSELINFIKSSGIVLPPNVAKIINGTYNPESPLKTSVSNRSDAISDGENKKLKIQLADTQFELKKIDEDFADFKRNTKLERQKDSKKYEQTLNKLKTTLELANEDGTYTVERMKKDNQLEIKAIRDKHKMELEQEITKLNDAYQIKIDSAQKLRKREVAELQRNSDRKFNERVKQYEEEIDKLTQTHANELRQINLKHRLVVEEKQKRYQSTYLALQSERKTEEKLHEKTKIQTSKQKQKLLCDLYYERNVKRQLEGEIEQKDKQIRRLKSQVKDRELDIVLKEEKYKKTIKEIQYEYQTKYNQFQHVQNEGMKLILGQHEKELQKYQQMLNKVEIIHKEREELLETSIKEISGSFEKRPSKKEDLTAIDKLKWSLTKREEQVIRLKQDLKHTNLELENKQDIYTRIFRGSSMSKEKKIQFKQDKEQMIIEEKLCKQIIFRKSQTADLKHLLKIYNNNKNM